MRRCHSIGSRTLTRSTSEQGVQKGEQRKGGQNNPGTKRENPIFSNFFPHRAAIWARKAHVCDCGERGSKKANLYRAKQDCKGAKTTQTTKDHPPSTKRPQKTRPQNEKPNPTRKRTTRKQKHRQSSFAYTSQKPSSNKLRKDSRGTKSYNSTVRTAQYRKSMMHRQRRIAPDWHQPWYLVQRHVWAEAQACQGLVGVRKKRFFLFLVFYSLIFFFGGGTRPPPAGGHNKKACTEGKSSSRSKTFSSPKQLAISGTTWLPTSVIRKVWPRSNVSC